MRYSVVGLCLLLVFAGDGIKSAHAETGSSFGDCQTPSKQSGTCLYFNECPSLYKLLEKGAPTPEERALLSASQCGYHNDQYLVCCPNEPVAAVTPMSFDGRVGVESILPELPNCLVNFKDRIVGGHDTAIDDFPWLAAIEYTKPDNTKGFHCGGSLINDRYVLTAAHCVRGRVPEGWTPTSVRLGEWDMTTNPDCEVNERGKKDCADPHKDVAVEKIVTHPHYVPASRNQQHDIALLRLAQPVPRTGYIKPICLPLDSSLETELFSGKILDAAGWGATETENSSQIKQTTNFTVWDINECRRKYSGQKIQLTNGQMCAGGNVGVDTCSGDSGGPLFYVHKTDRPYFILAGIVSFGPKYCGQDGWPGVYTRVGQYINWIRQNVEP